MDSLGRQISKIRAHKPTERDWIPTVDAPEIQERRLTVCPAPAVQKPTISLDGARSNMRAGFIEYLETPDPGYILLVKALPGTGKTTTAVSIVEALAARGYRVAYAGPRHDFWDDLQDKAVMPAAWYEWLPRQDGNFEYPADPDNPQTCLHTEAINTWLYRGYDGMDFCSSICGWDYVKKCRYHTQKTTGKPIIYLQHQHVSLGHPLADKFDVLIGDESPIGAFCHTWQIPGKWILPPGMDPTEPMAEILYTMQAIAANLPDKTQMSGPDLIDALGGAQAVIEAAEIYNLPFDSKVFRPIHAPSEAADAPFFHLPALSNLLERESKNRLAGQAYPHRIIISKNQLTLLLRRKAQLLPSHVIWLDATGRQDIYETIFERPVKVLDARPKLLGKITQVVDRTNGKQSLTGAKQTDPITDNAKQAETVIQAIIKDKNYQRPSIIGFKKYIDQSGLGELVKRGHFYAARGTNSHEDADAVFILGTPQASPYDIIKIAKQIYFDDDQAFDTAWYSKPVTYQYTDPDGQGRAYPAGGFWNDDRLQSILESIREDEIIQAAHRGRPVNHAVDIYLFTNVPVAGLPPDDLLTMRELLGIEPGVNIWQWRRFLEYIDDKGQASTKDLESDLKIHRATAREYIHRLGAQEGYHIETVTQGRGRPQISVVRDLTLEDL